MCIRDRLYDNAGELVGWMNAEQFINNDGNEINTYELVKVKLYFANADGDKPVSYTHLINQETLHSDQIPDIYLLSSDSLEKAYLAGLASKVPDTVGICNTDHFSQAALSAVTYDQKLIGYPVYFDTSALVYNEDYLRTWATQQAEKELAGSSENDEPIGEGEEIIEEDSLPEDQTTEPVSYTHLLILPRTSYP